MLDESPMRSFADQSKLSDKVLLSGHTCYKGPVGVAALG